ncbi:MAG TPA: MBL fold metallo-hydrolase [Candidatus Limnocylindria bacterium]|nr:MBL fold metallo-hydrolase [Candidatus Limnocylindria bacterium]
MHRQVLVVLTLIISLFVALPQLPTLWAEPRVAATAPAHHLRNGFRNLDPQYSYPVLDRARRFFKRGFEGWPERGVAPAVVPNDGAVVRGNGEQPTVTWVGHATLLVQLDGLNILTDPHWGGRASPVGFAGPRRLVAAGMRFEDLPPIHAVVISHDHYDHLDVDTVERLERAHRPTFFVPLGIKEWLGDRGVRNVVEMDWWQSTVFRGVTFVATPAQHSSGRGLHDQNQRLWSSWVILGKTRRFFFAGDTGYTPSMKEIGKRYGPFDVAAIPIGGYSAWSERHPNHVNPEEAVQLFEDVRGRLLVPLHWGTFELNREPFREPPDRLMAAALARGLEERMALLAPGQLVHW